MKTKEKPKLNPGLKQFLWKTGIFIILFIVFSFIVGISVFSNDLLTKWKIEIYGRIGYILLFSIVGFILLYRKRISELGKFKREKKDYFLIALSCILLGAFYLVSNNINTLNPTLFNIIWFHMLALSVFFCLAWGVFGTNLTHSFIKKFKKELFYFLIFAIITYSFMNLVWSLWHYLSLGVMKSTTFLLKIIGVDVIIFGTDGITVNGFSVIIAEACSGIYSIFIFTALYLFIVFLDWNKINKKKAALLFIPAIAGAFAFNILRVFTLMLVGAYISPNIALGLYHSYSGMLFFLIYFILFWGLLYKWMKK